jgi:hypothetical protein
MLSSGMGDILASYGSHTSRLVSVVFPLRSKMQAPFVFGYI